MEEPMMESEPMSLTLTFEEWKILKNKLNDVDPNSVSEISAENVDKATKDGAITNTSGYLISNADEKIKFSPEFKECVGISMFGISKETHKWINKVAHINSEALATNKLRFFKDLIKQLIRFRMLTKAGSRKGFFVGGMIIDNGSYEVSRENYISNMRNFIRIMKLVTGAKTEVAGGPYIPDMDDSDEYTIDGTNVLNIKNQVYVIKNDSENPLRKIKNPKEMKRRVREIVIESIDYPFWIYDPSNMWFDVYQNGFTEYAKAQKFNQYLKDLKSNGATIGLKKKTYKEILKSNPDFFKISDVELETFKLEYISKDRHTPEVVTKEIPEPPFARIASSNTQTPTSKIEEVEVKKLQNTGNKLTPIPQAPKPR